MSLKASNLRLCLGIVNTDCIVTASANNALAVILNARNTLLVASACGCTFAGMDVPYFHESIS